jgi:hypothetical protein
MAVPPSRAFIGSTIGAALRDPFAHVDPPPTASRCHTAAISQSAVTGDRTIAVRRGWRANRTAPPSDDADCECRPAGSYARIPAIIGP